MRCVACDKVLSEREERIKSPVTGEEYQMCLHDLKEAGLLHGDIGAPPPVEEEDPYMAISQLDEEFN